MDHSLFETMMQLGCKHPSDMLYDPLLRAKVNSVATYYRGVKVVIRPCAGGDTYQFIYASLETGWVIRTVNVGILRALTIRTIDRCKLLGKPYTIDYGVPMSEAEPSKKAKHDNVNHRLENATEGILVASAILITGGIFISRGLKEWNTYKTKK